MPWWILWQLFGPKMPDLCFSLLLLLKCFSLHNLRFWLLSFRNILSRKLSKWLLQRQFHFKQCMFPLHKQLFDLLRSQHLHVLLVSSSSIRWNLRHFLSFNCYLQCIEHLPQLPRCTSWLLSLQHINHNSSLHSLQLFNCSFQWKLCQPSNSKGCIIKLPHLSYHLPSSFYNHWQHHLYSLLHVQTPKQKQLRSWYSLLPLRFHIILMSHLHNNLVSHLHHQQLAFCWLPDLPPSSNVPYSGFEYLRTVCADLSASYWLKVQKMDQVQVQLLLLYSSYHTVLSSELQI